MNLLKNLVIIAVLAAVGYGVYVSLARNNAEVAQPPADVAEKWSTGPKVELPGVPTSPSSGGPLALGGTAPQQAGATSVNAPAAPLLPYKSSSPPDATPLPSSLATPSLPVPSPSTLPQSSLLASNAPAAGGLAATTPANTVRNLDPPPINAAATPQTQDVFPTTTASASPQTQNSLPSTVFSTPQTQNVLPPTNPLDSVLQSKFAAFMEAVHKKLDEGKLAEAQLALSTLYGNPDLPADQSKQITALLDQLAGTVIYSRNHYLEPPYVTQPGDTLDKVSQQYSVPWQLLARINGLMPPGTESEVTKDQPLPSGMELKVVRGPFEAKIRLDTHELVLMVQNRYAGRFPIGVGQDQAKLDGDYVVRDKIHNPTYYGPDGVTIAPNDPQNPLGGAWIGLSDRIGIHGTPDPRNVGRDDNRGSICVGQHDLEDLYGILSVGSRVTIVR
jgi:hypothetical protein